MEKSLIEKLQKIHSEFTESSSCDEIIAWFRNNGFYIVMIPFPTFASVNRIMWTWEFKYLSDGSDWSVISECQSPCLHYEYSAMDAIEEVVDFYIQTLNIDPDF